MKTLCKKFLTGCMALAMACTMAVPTFAAEPAIMRAGTSYSIQSVAEGTNVTSGGVGNNIRLGTSQDRWMVGSNGGTTKLYYIDSATGLVATYSYGNVVLNFESQASSGDTSFNVNTLPEGKSRLIFDQRNAYWNSSNGAIVTSWYNETSEAQKWYLNA